MSITIFTSAKNRFVMHCDFCGDTQHEAKLLISSPNGSHICDQCVIDCVEIVTENTNPSGDKE